MVKIRYKVSLKWWCIGFWLLLAICTTTGSADQREKDLLKIPGVQNKTPEKGLLLDVTTAGTRIVAVGENGKIIFSDNFGESWSQAKVPVCVTLTAVSFPTPLKGWTAGHDGVILHTTDGGQTWVKQIDGTHVNAAVFAQVKALFDQKTDPIPGSPAARFNEMDWMDFEIYMKDIAHIVEEGATWPFMDIRFVDEQTGFAVGAFGIAVQTTDGGKNWTSIIDRLVNPIGFHYYGIARVGSDFFLVGEMGQMLRSDNGGQTWERIASPYDGSFFGVTGTQSGHAVIVFGLRGNAFRSDNRGETWKQLTVPSGAAWMGGMTLASGSILLTAPMLGGVISTDGGVTFSPVPNFPYGSMGAVEIPEGGFVTIGALGAQRIGIHQTKNDNVAQGTLK